jgi:hypothetical protein
MRTNAMPILVAMLDLNLLAVPVPVMRGAKGLVLRWQSAHIF